MSCYTCKNKTSVQEGEVNGTNIFLRILYFIIGVSVVIILTPVIGMVGIYMLFNTIILDRSTEIMPSLTFAAELISKVRNKPEDDNDMEDEEFDPDDYELVGVEEIKGKDV